MQQFKRTVKGCETSEKLCHVKSSHCFYGLFTTLTYLALVTTIVLCVWINNRLGQYQDLKAEIDLNINSYHYNNQQETNSLLSDLHVEHPLNRVERDVNKRLKNKRGRGGRRKKRRRNKPKGEECFKPSALHLHIDTEYSQPNSPDLKTGPKGTIIRYWKKADQNFNEVQRFAKVLHNGSVNITEDGLYQIYSQITYYDRTGRWSHLVDINGKPFVKCLGNEWGIGTNPSTGLYYNTVHHCYTSAVTMIREGSIVSIKSMYPDRVIHADIAMTFWGIIKLS